MAMLLCGCSSMKHYSVFQYDNGNDPICDGMYRIVDKRGRIGYADGNGRTVIKPRFAFGFPFEEGKAKVTNKGEMKEVPGSGGEYHYWESDDWYYIDRKGEYQAGTCAAQCAYSPEFGGRAEAYRLNVKE